MNIEQIKKDFGIKHGQLPLTKFIDNLDNVTVELIDYPDFERLKRVFVNMTMGSWYEDFYKNASKEDVEEVIADMLKGKSLAQSSEHPQFCFRVSGVDLHITHAIVRNRIGIAYLQRSLAVGDLRHEDIVVPRAFTKNKFLLNEYKNLAISGKNIYSKLLETGEISNTDARIALLKSVPSWIHISCSLPTLLAIYGKRTDTQEEHIVLNKMSYLMKLLVCEKFPFMEKYFVSHDDIGRCLHQKEGYVANCIFKRDENHQLKEGQQDNWTLHDKTKKELMLDCEPYKTEFYYGYDKISEEEYNDLKIKLDLK